MAHHFFLSSLSCKQSGGIICIQVRRFLLVMRIWLDILHRVDVYHILKNKENLILYMK